MIDAITTIIGLAIVSGLFYGAVLIVMDKEQSYRARKEAEKNDSSRSIWLQKTMADIEI